MCIVPNVRQKEFAQEVMELLRLFLNEADKIAMGKHISPYDVEIAVDGILKLHKTYRCIATDDCVQRHFENLVNRCIFDDFNSKKLNRKMKNVEVDFLGKYIRMPEDKPL